MEKQAVDRPRCHSSVKDTSLNPDYKPNASLPQTCQDEIGAIKYIEALNLGVSPTAAALKLLSKHAHPLSRGEASSGSASSLRRNKSYYSSMATGSKASSAGSSAAKRKLQELELLNSIGVGRQGGREGGYSAAGGAGGTAGAAGAAGAGTTASRTADRSFSALSKGLHHAGSRHPPGTSSSSTGSAPLPSPGEAAPPQPPDPASTFMSIVDSFMPPYSLRPCLAKQVVQHGAGQAGPPEHEPLSSDLSKELMQDFLVVPEVINPTVVGFRAAAGAWFRAQAPAALEAGDISQRDLSEALQLLGDGETTDLFITVINFMYHDYVVGSPGFPRHQLMEWRRLAGEKQRARGLGRRGGAGQARSTLLALAEQCDLGAQMAASRKASAAAAAAAAAQAGSKAASKAASKAGDLTSRAEATDLSALQSVRSMTSRISGISWQEGRLPSSRSVASVGGQQARPSGSSQPQSSSHVGLASFRAHMPQLQVPATPSPHTSTTPQGVSGMVTETAALPASQAAQHRSRPGSGSNPGGASGSAPGSGTAAATAAAAAATAGAAPKKESSLRRFKAVATVVSLVASSALSPRSAEAASPSGTGGAAGGADSRALKAISPYSSPRNRGDVTVLSTSTTSPGASAQAVQSASAMPSCTSLATAMGMPSTGQLYQEASNSSVYGPSGYRRRGNQDTSTAGSTSSHFLDNVHVQQCRLVAMHEAMAVLVNKCRASGQYGGGSRHRSGGAGLHFHLPLLLLCLRHTVRTTFTACFPLWCLRQQGQLALALMDLAITELFDRHGFFSSASYLAAMPGATCIMQQHPGRQWHKALKEGAAAQPGATMAAVLGLGLGEEAAGLGVTSGGGSFGTRRLLAPSRRALCSGPGRLEGPRLTESLPLGAVAQAAALHGDGGGEVAAGGSVLKTVLTSEQRQEVLRLMLQQQQAQRRDGGMGQGRERLHRDWM